MIRVIEIIVDRAEIESAIRTHLERLIQRGDLDLDNYRMTYSQIYSNINPPREGQDNSVIIKLEYVEAKAVSFASQQQQIDPSRIAKPNERKS